MKNASKLPMTLLPKFPGLRFENISIDAETISLCLASTRPEADCPICGSGSDTLHSHYARTVSDLPWAGRAGYWWASRSEAKPEPGCRRTWA